MIFRLQEEVLPLATTSHRPDMQKPTCNFKSLLKEHKLQSFKTNLTQDQILFFQPQRSENQHSLAYPSPPPPRSHPPLSQSVSCDVWPPYLASSTDQRTTPIRFWVSASRPDNRTITAQPYRRD